MSLPSLICLIAATWACLQGFKRKKEKYELFWPQRPEFVRMAGRFSTTVVPISAVGFEDSIALVMDSDEIRDNPWLGEECMHGPQLCMPLLAHNRQVVTGWIACTHLDCFWGVLVIIVMASDKIHSNQVGTMGVWVRNGDVWPLKAAGATTSQTSERIAGTSGVLHNLLY